MSFLAERDEVGDTKKLLYDRNNIHIPEILQ
jgi:hypothetical protein